MRTPFRRTIQVLALAAMTLGAPQAARPQLPAGEGGDFSHSSHATPLPANTLIVTGAWSSASDSVTPVPESGGVADKTYSNKYFALSYAMPQGWIEKYTGPPPSDTGYYVLAQLKPADASRASRATILIAAQDLFFTLAPASSAFDLIDFTRRNLQADYQVERPPTPVTLASHAFVRFDYVSLAADLHWYVLATQIRCHMLTFVFTGHDARLLETLIQGMNEMTLPSEASPILGSGGNGVPVCIKDYARGEDIIKKVDPAFTEHRFNPIPVRIIIDREGKVKHIHFLSAFPDQAKAITDALFQWRFKPYLLKGSPTEVETGIVFGQAGSVVPSAPDAPQQ